jgi:predicted DNA-binding transcriptional regulator AlpA
MSNARHADVLAILQAIKIQMAGLQKLIDQCSEMIGRDDEARPVLPEVRPGKAKIFLTSVEAAELIGVTRSCLAVWRHSGTKGPRYLKVGGFIRYQRSDIDAWMEQHARKPVTIRK